MSDTLDPRAWVLEQGRARERLEIQLAWWKNLATAGLVQAIPGKEAEIKRSYVEMLSSLP